MKIISYLWCILDTLSDIYCYYYFSIFKRRPSLSFFKTISKSLNIPWISIKSIIKKWKEYGTVQTVSKHTFPNLKHSGGSIMLWDGFSPPGLGKLTMVNVLEWPSQSPDLNSIQNLWLDLKIDVRVRSLCNLRELEQFCKEKWNQISESRCQSLIEGTATSMVESGC